MRLLCTFFSILFLLYRVHLAYQLAYTTADDPQYLGHPRRAVWIDSAKCTQEKGVFLSVCGNDGEILPIEDCAVADDRGHALLANALAYLKNTPVTNLTLTKANILINAFGIFTLSLLLLCTRLYWASFLNVIFMGAKSIPGFGPGPDVIYALHWHSMLSHDSGGVVGVSFYSPNFKASNFH